MSRWHGRRARKLQSASSRSGRVDVDPQKPCRGDGVLVAAWAAARGGADEHLFAGAVGAAGVGAGDDALGVGEQVGQPVGVPAGAAGQVVLAASAAVDGERAVAVAGAGCEFDERGGVAVQQAELDRAVALRGERPFDDASVGERDAARQLRLRRGVGVCGAAGVAGWHARAPLGYFSGTGSGGAGVVAHAAHRRLPSSCSSRSAGRSPQAASAACSA